MRSAVMGVLLTLSSALYWYFNYFVGLFIVGILSTCTAFRPSCYTSNGLATSIVFLVAAFGYVVLISRMLTPAEEVGEVPVSNHVKTARPSVYKQVRLALRPLFTFIICWVLAFYILSALAMTIGHCWPPDAEARACRANLLMAVRASMILILSGFLGLLWLMFAKTSLRRRLIVKWTGRI